MHCILLHVCTTPTITNICRRRCIHPHRTTICIVLRVCTMIARSLPMLTMSPTSVPPASRLELCFCPWRHGLVTRQMGYYFARMCRASPPPPPRGYVSGISRRYCTIGEQRGATVGQWNLYKVLRTCIYIPTAYVSLSAHP